MPSASTWPAGSSAPAAARRSAPAPCCRADPRTTSLPPSGAPALRSISVRATPAMSTVSLHGAGPALNALSHQRWCRRRRLRGCQLLVPPVRRGNRQSWRRIHLRRRVMQLCGRDPAGACSCSLMIVASIGSVCARVTVAVPQVTLTLDAATYGIQSGQAVVGLVQTPGSQGASAMLNNDLSGTPAVHVFASRQCAFQRLVTLLSALCEQGRSSVAWQCGLYGTPLCRAAVPDAREPGQRERPHDDSGDFVLHSGLRWRWWASAVCLALSLFPSAACALLSVCGSYCMHGLCTNDVVTYCAMVAAVSSAHSDHTWTTKVSRYT